MVIDNTLQGVHIDLVQTILDQLSLKIKFHSVPWKRALIMIRNQKADAITYIGKSKQREKFVLYMNGNVISKTKNQLITWNDKTGVRFNGDLKTLKPYRIGMLRGYMYGEAFDQADHLKKYAFNKMMQLIQMLQADRIDMAIVNRTNFQYAFKESPLMEDIVFLAPPVSNIPNYIGFSKSKDLELLAFKFARALSAFKATGEYQNILKKYGLK